MNTRFASLIVIACTLITVTYEGLAQTSTFTYQGRLTDGAAPANGVYDIRCALYNGSSAGSQVGLSLTNAAVGVTNGLFTISLDFGAASFDGNGRWLEIGVRTNGASTFATLSPRQPITSTPYAVLAANAATAANVTGQIALSQLPSSLLTNNETSVTLNGSFSGTGTGLTNVPLAGVNSLNTIRLLTNGLNFLLSYSPTVGGGGGALAAADLNGDGKADLIARGNGNDLVVLTNNGSGIFGLDATLATGSNPTFVIVNDINGDGKPDLVSANSFGSNLTVYTNSGSAVFGLYATLAVGASPQSVAAADVNGDGRIDLISANSSDNTLTVLINNGNGTFLPITVPAGHNPRSVVAADINSDGKQDLICANYTDATLTVFTNNGSGAFGSNATLNAGSAPNSVIAADMNADGKVDLITVTTNAFVIFTNNGAGAFGVNAVLPVNDAYSYIVVAADLDGDGRMDLATANGNRNTVQVYLANGTGGFINAGAMPVSAGPSGLVAIDLNGDGKLDLVSAGIFGTLSILTNASGTVSGEITLSGQSGGLRFSSFGNDVNVINGAAGNLVTLGISGAVIAGGGAVGAANVVNGSYSAVGGGTANTAGGQYAAIGGGSMNRTTADYGAVAGGNANTADNYAFVGGGFQNAAQGAYSVVAGGAGNSASGPYSAVAGGNGNFTGSEGSFVGGGEGNSATGFVSVVVGGENNSIQSSATGGTIGGGVNNSIIGTTGTVPGGSQNTAGVNAFAAGLRAKAINQGAFVWADSQNADLASTAANQFLVRASGGVGINMNNPNGASLYVSGNRTNGWANSVGFVENLNTTTNASPALRVVVAGGRTPDGALSVSANVAANTTNSLIAEFGNSSSFVVTITNDGTIYTAGDVVARGTKLTSDRNAKQNFKALDSKSVLARVVSLPVTQWSYKNDSMDTKHIGPVAQDFHAAFGLDGDDDKHISVVDEGGVALAAIQGLNQKLAEKDVELKEMQTRLRNLEELVKTLRETK